MRPPRATAYLWWQFLRLRRRQKPGWNGPDPASFLEFEALERSIGAGFRFNPWEAALLEQLDDICVSQSRKAKRPTPIPDKGVVTAVSVRDAAGVRALLRSLGRRKDPNKGMQSDA